MSEQGERKILTLRLKEKRIEAGLSLTEASKRSGVARSYLYQLESGESMPTIDKLQVLAAAYDTSVSYLIGETEADTLGALRAAQRRLEEALDAMEVARWVSK
jgi:transcriptional regulator with XRE-family HTH domain